ncbi:hypothetical protein D3C72_1606850 [compost metagenome]
MVLARDLIPARLFAPSWGGDGVAEGPGQGRLLRHRHDQGFARRQVLTEALMELVGLDPQIAVAVGDQVGGGGWRVLLGDAAGAFAGIRREGGDEDQGRDIGQIARLRQHRPAIGVPDQDDRSLLLSHHLAHPLGVVGQRGQRHVDGVQRAVASPRQFGDDLAPVGGAAPEAVDEDDGGGLGHGWGSPLERQPERLCGPKARR